MGGLIMGLDGIAVDSYVRTGQHFDITTMGMEFSFILGTLGRTLGLLPDEAYQLIICGAIISIAVNPVVFKATEVIGRAWEAVPTGATLSPVQAAPAVASDSASHGDRRAV